MLRQVRPALRPGDRVFHLDTMKMHSFPAATTAAVLGLSLLTAGASAVPTTLTLDPAAEGVNRADFTIDVDMFPLGTYSGEGTSDASGTIDADINFAADNFTPTTIEFLDTTDLGFSDVVVIGDVLEVPMELARTENVRGTLTSPVLTVLADGSVDLGGSVLTLDEGFVGVLGDDPANNDLSGNPIVLTIPAGNVATLASTDLGNGQVSLVLSGPISFSGEVDNDPLTTLTISGNLLARGTVMVPEPATLALLPTTLLALRRRRA